MSAEKSKQMHFEQRSSHLMGARAVAEVGGAPVRSARQAPDLDRKDALQRRSLVLDADVGGVEAELAADLVAVHDAAVDRVGAAEQARRVFESGPPGARREPPSWRRVRRRR
jgi:hypothetical protein